VGRQEPSKLYVIDQHENQRRCHVLATESATTWASGNVVELCGVGPNLTLKRDGVTVLTAIDSNLTGGRIGLRIREDDNLANLEISAFSGGDVDATGAFRPIT
jgi:hypothetical protein